MKTTVNIPDGLARKVKETARQRGITVTALIEESLRYSLGGAPSRGRVPLRLTTFSGKGDEGVSLSWDAIRDKVYP